MLYCPVCDICLQNILSLELILLMSGLGIYQRKGKTMFVCGEQIYILSYRNIIVTKSRDF